MEVLNDFLIRMQLKSFKIIIFIYEYKIYDYFIYELFIYCTVLFNWWKYFLEWDFQ